MCGMTWSFFFLMTFNPAKRFLFVPPNRVGFLLFIFIPLPHGGREEGIEREEGWKGGQGGGKGGDKEGEKGLVGTLALSLARSRARAPSLSRHATSRLT